MTRVFEILQQKEDQARKDIGDPSLLMGKFDVDQEENFTREAIESGESAENFAARLCIPDEDIDHSDERSGDVETVVDDDVFDPLSFSTSLRWMVPILRALRKTSPQGERGWERRRWRHSRFLYADVGL